MKKTHSLSKSELEHHHKTQLQSKLTRAEYCRRHDINYKQLSSYATKQTNEKSKVGQNNSGFIPISVISKSEPPIQPNEFTLRHSDGSELSWKTHWSPEEVLEFVSGWRLHS